MKPNPEHMMTPKPDKEMIKKMYKMFGGNPRDGNMPRLLKAIDAAYAQAFPDVEE